ncbi:transposase [Roseateles sp.]|uniref:transposase n=1 Tax=Roseateles sp. TaxID=1971397 RepID=UPI003BA74C61
MVSLSDQIKPLFAQVLMTCDAQGLIGREMFAIDGVKLPSNASKERSGTHEELRHCAARLEKAADKILALPKPKTKRGLRSRWKPSLRHNKRMNRLNLRGQAKVRTQWSLYCMVHNIEKLQRAGFGQTGVQ